MNNIRNTIYGAMFGVAVGDALGAPLEFMDADSIQQQHGTVRDMIGGGWLNVLPGEVTDDTQMTLAVARGIIESPEDPIISIGKRFIAWASSGPKDIGATCASSIHGATLLAGYERKPSKADWIRASYSTHTRMDGRSAGNGSLMRTAYVGLYYMREKDAEQKAFEISRMTHFDEETAIDCSAYSSILNRMVTEESFDVRHNILVDYTDRRNGRYPFDIISSPFFRPNPTGYVVDSFAAALHCIYTTNSFEEALVKAVNLGGDADTIGAITGGLAGALYGFEAIPKRWTRSLSPNDRAEINVLCDIAEAFRK